MKVSEVGVLPPMHRPEVLFSRLVGRPSSELPSSIYDHERMAGFLYPLVETTLEPRSEADPASLEMTIEDARVLRLQHQGVTTFDAIYLALEGLAASSNVPTTRVASIYRAAERVIHRMHQRYEPAQLDHLLRTYAVQERPLTDVMAELPVTLRQRAHRLSLPLLYQHRDGLQPYLAQAFDSLPDSPAVEAATQYLLAGPAVELGQTMLGAVNRLREVAIVADQRVSHYKIADFNQALTLKTAETELLQIVLQIDDSSAVSGLGRLLQARPLADEFVLRQDIVRTVRRAIVIAAPDSSARQPIQ